MNVIDGEKKLKISDMKKQYIWKFLLDGMKSSTGKCVWKIGEWKKKKGAKICSKGFHGSEKIIDALSYVQGINCL